MPFMGFPPSGLDLMIENRLMDSQEFYEAHKAEIRKQMIEKSDAGIDLTFSAVKAKL